MITMTKNRLVPKDLGNAKDVLKAEGDAVGKPLYLGRMIGEASEVRNKVDAMSRPYTVLVGKFKAIPAKPFEAKDDAGNKVSVEAIVAGTCVLPPDQHNKVSAELAKEDVSLVQFAIDVFSVKYENSTLGYVFSVNEIFPINGADTDQFAGINARIASAQTAANTDAEATQKTKAA